MKNKRNESINNKHNLFQNEGIKQNTLKPMIIDNIENIHLQSNYGETKITGLFINSGCYTFLESHVKFRMPIV